MTLKEIATQALDAVAEKKSAENADSPVAVTNNPDGTVTYSVIVTFDPAVQKKMARAMAKGVKRDDLADDLGDAEEVDVAEVEEVESAEDEAPRGVFETAIDEIVFANDAKPSKHSQTPLENCRAKDPMYCPYHGDKAIKKAIEDNLLKQGIDTFTVNVAPNGKGKYGVSVMTPLPDPKVATAILGAFFVGNNMKDGIAVANPTGSNVTVEIDKDADTDRAITMLDEWMDDMMADIVASPDLMEVLDKQDLRDLLDSRAALDGVPKENPDYDKALDDVRQKYRFLRAQVDMADIKTHDEADAAVGALNDEWIKLDKEYHDIKAPVDAAKIALFGGSKPKMPPGFAKEHPWAEENKNLSSRLGYFIKDDYEKANNKDLELSKSETDIKQRRQLISEMKYRKETYEDALEAYKKNVPEFLKNLKAWAQEQVDSGEMSQEKFDTAFPKNAKSQQTTSASAANQQNSSGKVNLPQSWNNFVMGDNLVMPTDGLPDIPYGKEKGFHDAFDIAFPKMPVPYVMESFEIKPHSGEVIYSLSPGATALNANAPKYFVNALWGAGYVGAKLQPMPQKQGFEVVIPFNANLAGK